MNCAIISGGSISDYGKLGSILSDCDYIICADSGIVHAKQAGFAADIWVGDFDSVPAGEYEYKKRITLPTEKDDTDTMHAARIAVEIGADSVIMLGCTGTRFDHSYANFFVMKFLEDNGVKAKIIDAHNEIFLLINSSVDIKNRSNCFLSVLPFCCTAKGVCEIGTKYPLENATLTAEFPIGVSNEIAEPFATIKVESGCLAVFISHD